MLVFTSLLSEWNTEAVMRRCSVEKVFFDILQNLQENTCARVPFLINFIKKETLAQVFFCEFCEISNKTFFIEHLRWLLLEIMVENRRNMENICQYALSNVQYLIVKCLLKWNMTRYNVILTYYKNSRSKNCKY